MRRAPTEATVGRYIEVVREFGWAAGTMLPLYHRKLTTEQRLAEESERYPTAAGLKVEHRPRATMRGRS